LSDPPDLQEPTRTRPNLFDYDPPTTLIVGVTPGVSRSFSARVQSEDAGDDLVAALYLNYDFEGQQLIEFVPVDASTLADLSRRIRINGRPNSDHSGCRQVTLQVTHNSNRSREDGRILDPRDVALATWWANVEGDGEISLDDCPSNTGGQP
jgi:hypothetical protein